MSSTLRISFGGWCLIRLATDPDPTDEPRGVSGYTFAFGNEPDLDRIIYLQPPAYSFKRSHGPEIGVRVLEAHRITPNRKIAIGALRDARVELLDRPKLENRNWALTLPGFEPIVPFHLHITGKEIELDGTTPIDPKHLWETKEVELLSYGANGMQYEPTTVGEATRIWDAEGEAKKRLKALKSELKDPKGNLDEPKRAILEGRIAELKSALKRPKDEADRRIYARNYVERFGFPLTGRSEISEGHQQLLGGTLDSDKPWQIYFWLGAWDPDALCAFMQGRLAIPYLDSGE